MKRGGDTRLTPSEAAKRLGVSVERVRVWCESGELPSYQSIHHWRMIERKALIAFARKQPDKIGAPTTQPPMTKANFS